MSDLKSKLPDLQELSSMTSKLYHGIKNSITEIVHDYKEKRAGQENAEQQAATMATQETTVVKPAPKDPPVAPAVGEEKAPEEEK